MCSFQLFPIRSDGAPIADGRLPIVFVVGQTLALLVTNKTFDLTSVVCVLNLRPGIPTWGAPVLKFLGPVDH